MRLTNNESKVFFDSFSLIYLMEVQLRKANNLSFSCRHLFL